MHEPRPAAPSVRTLRVRRLREAAPSPATAAPRKPGRTSATASDDRGAAPADATRDAPVELAFDDDDAVAVEEPLEIRMGADTSTVLLRTPGDDEDLVTGFLLTEGVVAAPAEILRIRGLRDAQGALRGSVVEVDLEGPPAKTKGKRFRYSSSSCGACGKDSLASLAVRGARSTSAVRVRRDVLGALPARMRDAQRAFAATGGIHASALFTPAGELVALREDIGRHNALDKLIGWAARAGRLPLDGHVLVLSGRISFELVQKAIAGRIAVVAAVGAPSSLAVDLADQFGVTLAGFVRPGSLNVYTHPERIV